MKRGAAKTAGEGARDAERSAGGGDGAVARPGGAARSVPLGQLRFGWWALLVFLSLGSLLEGLHAFKIGWYLAGSSETRRLLWTLAHAHGTLLAIVNIIFALSVPHLRSSSESALRLAGRALIGATIALPCGFLLGGAVIYEGDPGIGIILVPVGAILLFAGVFLTARARARGTAEAAPAMRDAPSHDNAPTEAHEPPNDWSVIDLERLGPEAFICISCSYDLRGTDLNGSCPECGVSVYATLRWRQGDLAQGFDARAERLMKAALLFFAVTCLGTVAHVYVAITVGSRLLFLLALPIPAIAALLVTAWYRRRTNPQR